MGTATGLSLEWLFFLGYLLTAALFAAGVALIGDRLYVSRWSTAALLMALTLRHRIARTGVNTYESAFHPRVLTFAIGLLAVGLFLRGRRGAALTLALFACLVHPTTGAWFVIWVTVAAAVEAWPSRGGPTRGHRRRVLAGVAAASASSRSGALAERLAVMDAPWLAAFESRDYLFPSDDWKVGTWLTHLLPSLVIVAVWQWRRRLGLTTPHEHAVVLGCLALLLGVSGIRAADRRADRAGRAAADLPRVLAARVAGDGIRRVGDCRIAVDARMPAARRGVVLGGRCLRRSASRAATTSCASSTITGWSPCTCRRPTGSGWARGLPRTRPAGACAGRPRPRVERRRQPARDRQARRAARGREGRGDRDLLARQRAAGDRSTPRHRRLPRLDRGARRTRWPTPTRSTTCSRSSRCSCRSCTPRAGSSSIV